MVNMPGIGKKTAERLIVEMRDRLAEWEGGDEAVVCTGTGETAGAVSREAEAALVSLGYKPQQAARAVGQVLKDNPDVSDSESLIRQALKNML